MGNNLERGGGSLGRPLDGVYTSSASEKLLRHFEAEESYKNLMDLGMNVDSRYSGRIFEVASTMLRNAIDAKSNKIDKKLKMVELQLKKQKIDQTNNDGPAMEEQDGFVVTDRNELMKKLLRTEEKDSTIKKSKE